MRHGLLSIAALSGTLGLAGCQQLTEQQRMWLTEGERAYQRQQYSRAIEQLTRFVNGALERPEVGRALYVRALAHARQGQRLQARTDLSRCVEITEDADVRWRAFSMLGTIDYEDGQWAAAARSYAVAAERAPRVPPTDVFLFRLGVCYERSGRWGKARGPYQRIVNEFPTSSLVKDARRRLEIKATHFAVQCGVFSDRQNADRLVAELKSQGLPACVRREPRGGVPRHVVLVGRYRTCEEALGALARVKGHVPEALLWP